MSNEKKSNQSLLGVSEFAAAVGMSPKTIRQWVWMRRVPYVRVGRAIRFRQETVEEILKRGEVPALERL
jgi:excisionase family DNA binding protein